MTNSVHNVDCLEFMRSLPDNSFDLCIADPWYGIGMTKNDTTGFAKNRFRLNPSSRKALGVNDLDNQPPPKEHFDEMRRISKNQIVWGGNYFFDYLGNCRAPYIWDKGTGLNYFADGEMAWTSFKTGTLRIFKHQWCGAFKESERGRQLIHPCQKPIALYKDLLRRFTKPGDKIFSPYVGSGSDRIACYDMEREFIGCELDRGYWKNQEKRFEQHKQQLFTPSELSHE